MKTSIDCVPCFVRQSLDACRLLTDDVSLHEQVLRRVLRDVADMDMSVSPPVMGQHIHRLIRQFTGNSDPYKPMKDQFNNLAMSIFPELEKSVRKSSWPMETAVRLAIAGNVIDFGVTSDVSDEFVLQAVKDALNTPFDGDVKEFEETVAGAESILYLCDNTGEIVFDKLLIGLLPAEKTTAVVRGAPTINDATMEDAQTVGLTDMVNVIDNGTDAPGTPLDQCSAEFVERFNNADVVIAKGQGNYETLSDVGRDVFFILKAKCPVIADDIGCSVGSMILKHTERSVV